ncbi:predicted signal transduction protein [hydrothermal vent metagenome]|uniref:Predicted signal transduction protein n=1 Tax=hydrothermal vent metagenome TaxID=652676 RepID=A0A3B0YGY4_9ZZZZ
MGAAEKKSGQHNIDYWVKHLTQEEMPAFAHTARIIAGEASDDESSASRLAKLILQDPSMTVRLLKMANSPFFNPNRAPINTVSRAIVLLGFKAVRSMCMSIAIIDSIVEGKDKSQVTNELSNCFHAAVQAREIATRRHDKAPEEVFIASLLKNMGKFAFWTFARKIDKGNGKLLDQLSRETDSNESLEKDLLGFSLQDLSAALNHEWKLSPLLDDTLSKKSHQDPRVASVTLAHEIANTSKKGWNSPEMKDLVKRLSEVLYMPIDRVNEMVRKNADLAATTLRKLGAPKIAALIENNLSSENHSISSKNSTTSTVNISNHSSEKNQAQALSDNSNFDANNNFPEPNPGLQLQILSDISHHINKKPDINLILEMILEGLHRGVGMDRAIFALIASNKKHLKTKSSVGWGHLELGGQFHFKINIKPGNVFDLALKKRKILQLSLAPNNPLHQLIPEGLKNIIGNSEALIMTASIGEQPIGIFYADRKPSKRKLDEACYSSFELFCQQANLGLLKLRPK